MVSHYYFSEKNRFEKLNTYRQQHNKQTMLTPINISANSYGDNRMLRFLGRTRSGRCQRPITTSFHATAALIGVLTTKFLWFLVLLVDNSMLLSILPLLALLLRLVVIDPFFLVSSYLAKGYSKTIFYSSSKLH